MLKKNKTLTLEQFKEKHYGKRGSAKRETPERENPAKRIARTGRSGYPGRTRGEKTPCKNSVNPVRRVLTPVIPVEDDAAVYFLSPVSP